MTSAFGALNVLVYASFAYLYFFSTRVIGLRPLYFYLFTAGVTACLVIASQRFNLAGQANRRLAWWALGFLGTCGLAYLWSRQSGIATSYLIIALHEAVLLVCFLYLFRSNQAVRRGLYACVLVALLGVTLNFVDYFALESWRLSIIPGRAAGLYENPNLSGQYLVLTMALGIWVLPRHLRVFFTLAVGLGVLLTFSRSAIVVWLVAMIALIWYGAFPYKKALVWVAVGGGLAFVAGSIMLGTMPGLLEAAGLTERLNADTIDRMSGSFFSQRDLSSRDRLAVAQQGLRLFLDSPMLGAGLGATREGLSVGAPHNMYILLAAEMGVLGLAMFFSLIWILWSTGAPVARIIVLVLAVSSLFSHNQLEQVAMMVVLSLAVSAAAYMPAVEQNRFGRTVRWSDWDALYKTTEMSTGDRRGV